MKDITVLDYINETAVKHEVDEDILTRLFTCFIETVQNYCWKNPTINMDGFNNVDTDLDFTVEELFIETSLKRAFYGNSTTIDYAALVLSKMDKGNHFLYLVANDMLYAAVRDENMKTYEYVDICENVLSETSIKELVNTTLMKSAVAN